MAETHDGGKAVRRRAGSVPELQRREWQSPGEEPDDGSSRDGEAGAGLDEPDREAGDERSPPGPGEHAREGDDGSKHHTRERLHG
jgi:hypothetical protein